RLQLWRFVLCSTFPTRASTEMNDERSFGEGWFFRQVLKALNNEDPGWFFAEWWYKIWSVK
ncbi:MAG TPA: hypothetical protein VLG69_04635, partial [Candidatus Andersenbacteria bacterium]|nr:hypothetical protein [Candidatus Andersenbacteria bacterium]